MRKKFTKVGLSGIAYLLLAVGPATAQIYSEDFEGVTAPALPAGMTDRNVDGSIPDPALATLNFGSHGWVTTELSNGGKGAISYSYTTPQADDWLRTPAIVIPVGNYGLTWKGTTDYAAPNNDGYEVRVSITDTAITSFTDVIFSTPGEATGATFTSHLADLSAYSGKTIYIAFRNNSANKTYLLIDDIVVDGSSSASINEDLVANRIIVSPNPVQNELTVGFSIDHNETINVNIVNTLGQTVFTQAAKNYAAGEQEVKINTADLTNGVYFIQIGTGEGVVSQRFIKAG